jgi:ribosomal protein L11 methyltransferase
LTGVYIEVDFRTGTDRQLKDILISELADIGFESFMDNDTGFLAYTREEDYSKASLDELVNRKASTIEHRIRRIEPENWNALWEAQFDPIEVGNEVLIRAPFHEPNYKFKYELIIEPKMSFGTGHHATTRLMCAALMKLDIGEQDICDMGCGTGILGILAAKRGAKSVLGIDIEDWAVENSIENVARNFVEMDVEIGDASNLTGKSFDGMLANINRNILVADFQAYRACLKPGAWILLSGFLGTDVDIIRQAGENLGFTLMETYAEDTWRCMLMIG